MYRLLLLSLLFLVQSCATQAQNEEIYNDDPMQKVPLGMEESHYFVRGVEGLPQVSARVEPPNWWVDMAESKVEVMIYRRNVKGLEASVSNYAGVSVVETISLDNPNYLFVTLDIAPGTATGSFEIVLTNSEGQVQHRIPYELLPQPTAVERGLSSNDFMYLIMPDRFANGNRRNDSVEGMTQQGVNRDKFLFRHGGDLMGIMEHLDYLEELGVTALWLNPVMENDQPYESYHGYAVTDHYRIDRRFGSNEQYRQLVELAWERGIKIVMDVIFNHVGDQHFTILDMPAVDWIHQWPEYTKTTYRATTLMDPHVAARDLEIFSNGWFDHHMPDLNQQQPQLANYLIQNSIWWTLYSGQAGFRIDTYAYCDQDFMAEWNRRMLEQFPELGIFGETWVHGPGVQSWFTGGGHLSQSFDSHLPGVTDFQLYYAINEALGQDPGWTNGVLRMYYTLAQDHLYQDPNRNVLFLDNHDLARLFTVVNQDEQRFRTALTLLMTLRGIPMINYGTELGFTGAGGAFGEGGRMDFPGGWRGDDRNLFEADERTAAEQSRFSFLQQLANFRKESAALGSGSLTQYLPQDGLYVYFREAGDERVVVVFNGHPESRSFEPEQYGEAIKGARAAYELTTDQELELDTPLEIEGKGVRVLVLR
ncbi:MAG: glycoside hydrolase family 13 protein [Bacteroidota bacterium]